MRIVPTVYQFPLRNDFANRAIGRTGPPAYESLEIGIHSDQVQNPDGSQTNTYLEVSLMDAKSQSVAVPGEGELSDMDNVDNPDDSDEPGPVVTPYSLTLQRPDPEEYFLHIKSVRTGSFTLEVEARRLSAADSSQDTLAEMDIPVYPRISFELKFVCYAPLFGEPILDQFPAIHQPHDPISPRIDGLLRRPIPAQAIAIMGLAKRWREACAGMIGKRLPGRHLPTWFFSGKAAQVRRRMADHSRVNLIDASIGRT